MIFAIWTSTSLKNLGNYMAFAIWTPQERPMAPRLPEASSGNQPYISKPPSNRRAAGTSTQPYKEDQFSAIHITKKNVKMNFRAQSEIDQTLQNKEVRF